MSGKEETDFNKNVSREREDLLKHIFGNVGELMDDFSCAVESTVLLHGRLYVTDRFVCFYSNLFGLEKKIRIPFSHIAVVTKENTAVIIPNAIAISTFKKQYIFRSFWDRDHCFFMLKSFINKYSQREGPSLGLAPSVRTDEDEDDFAPSVGVARQITPMDHTDASLPDEEGHNFNKNENNEDETTSSTSSYDNDKSNKSHEIDHEEHMDEDNFDGDNMGTSKQEISDDPEAAENFRKELQVNKLKISVVSEAILPVSVAEFASLFVLDNAPFSWLKYHESCNDSSLEVTEWNKMSVNKESKNVGSGREMKFLKPVGLPGLKETRGVKLQKYLRFGSHGLIVCSSTRLEDVPSADAFTVEDMICIRAGDDSKSCTVDISFEVKWIKGSWLRSVIDSNTVTEMTQWEKDFFKHLKQCAAEKVADRHVKLASIKEKLANVGEEGDMGVLTRPVTGKNSVVHKSMKKVVEHVSESMESWQRVEGRRFFVLCFFLIFITSGVIYWKVRTMHREINDLQEMIKSMSVQITELHDHGVKKKRHLIH